jgi:hypothetical protein
MQQFLAKSHTPQMCQLLHSPDMDPHDFFFFAQIKNTLKGKQFEMQMQTSCNAANFADAQNRVQEVLPTVKEHIKVKGASKEGD